MMIHNLVNEHIKNNREESTWDERHKGKLAVSEIGHCPRKALLRIHNIPETDPFDEKLLRLMWSGQMAEHKLEAVLSPLPEFQSQIHVENDYFVGTVDFLIKNAVVEHKETATSNFHYFRLPYDFHLLQVLAYKSLLNDEGLEAILYYQNRADWAEFNVRGDTGQIIYEGHINGKYRIGDLPTTVDMEMQKLMFWQDKNEVAPRPETPFEENFWCTRMYSANAYPSCTYFSHCWQDTEYEDAEKIPIPEEYLKQ